MLKLVPFTAAALILAGGAPAPALPTAPAADQPARVCFLPQTVRNYRTDGDTTAYLRVGRGEVYQLESGGCRGLGMSRDIQFLPESGGQACVGQSIGIVTRGPSLMGENNSRCTARIMKRLSAEEIAALPGRVRP